MNTLLKVLLPFLAAGLLSAQPITKEETYKVKVNGREYLARKGYLLVRHKTNVGVMTMTQVHAMANVQVEKSFDYPSGLQLVKVRPGHTTDAAVEALSTSDGIEYAEPDYIWTANDFPNDPMYPKMWQLNNKGQTGGKIDADINALEAWNLTTGSSDVVLGIIDTGVDYTHPDLKNSVYVNTQEIPGNGIDDDHNGYVDDVYGINAITGTGNPMDDNMHGTHVAGTIAAQGNNGVGVIGVAPNTKVIACKFLSASGSGSTSDAITCMNYFAQLATRSVDPVHIVATNNSWAGGPFSQALYDAIAAQRKAGILFMAAASNDGKNNDTTSVYPANFFLSNLISVAASDSSDNLASFSNYGRYSVAVAAPGVDILSTIPNNRYGYLSGTSMATPHVTGLAGLIQSYRPSLNWIQIKNLILSSGTYTTASLGNTYSGRRIRAADQNGAGALTCVNQAVSARMWPRSSSVSMSLGQTLPLVVMGIHCEKPDLSATVSISRNGGAWKSFSLLDDGLNYDEVKGDGIFSGGFKPTQTGRYRVKLAGNGYWTVTVQ